MGEDISGRRLAILCSNFWPEPTGSGQVLGELARFLADHHVAVRVATSMPYYPEWSIWPRYRGRLFATEHLKGLVIFRSWHFVSRSGSTLARIIHEVTLSTVAIPNMLRALRGAQVAYVLSPALSYAFIGCLVAAVRRVPCVLMVHDVMPDTAVELGMMRNRLLITVSRWMARCIYGLAEEIQTLSDGMRARIALQTRPDVPISVVPITIDADELAPIPERDNDFRRRFVPKGTLAVLHAGNMGRKQDLDVVLRAARRLQRVPGIHFYIFGDGTEKDRFLRRKVEFGLSNVSHHPLQERGFLPHMLSGADIVLVTQSSDVVDVVVPSKLITSLGAGAMVVAACPPESEAAQVLSASGGGLRIPPGDDEALAETVLAVRRGEIDVASYRCRARAYALAKYDREAIYGRLAKSLEPPTVQSGL